MNSRRFFDYFLFSSKHDLMQGAVKYVTTPISAIVFPPLADVYQATCTHRRQMKDAATNHSGQMFRLHGILRLHPHNHHSIRLVVD